MPSAGFFGVPVYRVGEDWWWGGDRARFAEAALTGEPVAPTVAPGDGTGRVVEVFHDFSSPFSYLGVTQIERVAAEVGATVRWRPFLLGAVFKAIGTPLVPMMAFNAAKSRYYLRDLHEWAAYWGVDFAYNTHFPLRTVTALRVALQAPELTHALYRAAWAGNRNIADRTCSPTSSRRRASTRHHCSPGPRIQPLRPSCARTRKKPSRWALVVHRPSRSTLRSTGARIDCTLYRPPSPESTRSHVVSGSPPLPGRLPASKSRTSGRSR